MIDSIIKTLEHYKGVAEKTFEQLSDEELHYEAGDDVNSISIIVKHLWGNMLSRWTNFLTEDGEKSWRDRDAEFESTIKTREELLEKWEEGWNCFFKALNSVKEEDFNKIIYIRNEGHTVIEAIHRQLAHYSGHIGQIIYMGKIIKGQEWQSLSIPKGQSKAFNEEKFKEEKGIRHFSEDKK